MWACTSEMKGDRHLSCWSEADFEMGSGILREGVGVAKPTTVLIERGIGDWREDEERGNGR